MYRLCCAVLNCFSPVLLFVTLWPGSSDHGILQTRILEWVAMPSSRGSFGPGVELMSLSSTALTDVFFTTSATWEAQIYTYMLLILVVQRKQRQHSKAIILQLKLNFKKLPYIPIKRKSLVFLRGVVRVTSIFKGPAKMRGRAPAFRLDKLGFAILTRLIPSWLTLCKTLLTYQGPQFLHL